MDAFRTSVEFAAAQGIGLPNRSVLRVENARGKEIRVEHGCVWITQDGDTRDIILEAGKAFRFDCDGKALVTALGSAPLTLLSIDE